MSHSPTVPISTVEVQAAIEAVDALIVGLDKVPQ
jgi:translation initiation factor 2B subunit (eIF-2B alpha/beta/delta family)